MIVSGLSPASEIRFIASLQKLLSGFLSDEIKGNFSYP
jgi:hypothetical protein